MLVDSCFFFNLVCVPVPVYVFLPVLVYVLVPVGVSVIVDIFLTDPVPSNFHISACVYNTVHVPVHSFLPAPVSVNVHVSLNLSYSVTILASLRNS